MHKTRLERQSEAITRQLARDRRTNAEQLKRIRMRDQLDGRGGASRAETARLKGK